MAETLPDLSKDVSAVPVTSWADEDDTIEAAAEAIGMPPIEDLLQRGEEFAKKIEKSETTDKPKTVTVRDAPAHESADKGKARVPGKGQKKQVPVKQTKKSTAAAARNALKMMAAAASAEPALKAHVPPAQNKEVDVSSSLASTTSPVDDGEQESPEVRPLDEWEQTSDPGSTGTVGAFPEVASQDIGETPGEYHELSIASSTYEGVSEDVAALSRRNHALEKTIGEQSIRIAKLEAALAEAKTDNTQFMTTVLDRLRATERALGNRPSVATSATEVVVGERSGPEVIPEDKPTMTAEEKKKRMMAALKNKKK